MVETKSKRSKFTTHEQLAKSLTTASLGSPAEEISTRDLIPNLQVKTLPSKWYAYPPHSSISYNPYVFGEIKQFNQSKLIGRPRIEFILKGIKTSFPKEDLTLADMLYIGLMRKISTLGDAKVKVTFFCSSCGESNGFHSLNSHLEFDDILAEKLPIVVTLSDKEYHFLPLTVKSYLELLDLDLQDDEIHTYAKMCINSPYEENYKRFYNATTDEGVLLETADELLYHGVTPIKRVCTKCGYSSLVEVEGGEILISPFREDSEPTPNRIRFGI